MNSIEQILWGVCAGLALALIYTFYIKRVQGGLIRRLLAADALTEGSAVSLSALGYVFPELIAWFESMFGGGS